MGPSILTTTSRGTMMDLHIVTACIIGMLITTESVNLLIQEIEEEEDMVIMVNPIVIRFSRSCILNTYFDQQILWVVLVLDIWARRAASVWTVQDLGSMRRREVAVDVLVAHRFAEAHPINLVGTLCEGFVVWRIDASFSILATITERQCLKSCSWKNE